MEINEQHLNRLRLAEQQFRLACTVNLAVFTGEQTLDVPVKWTFGRHTVTYDEFGLRSDQADLAGLFLEMTTTHVLAAVVRDAIVQFFNDPKKNKNPEVVASYQISRLIRNAFAHSMLYPKWSIDKDCQNKIFCIDDIISLDTSGLHEQPLDWRHYGGPLAIFRFSRFVREKLLNDPVDPNREKPPYPIVECYQQGRLILRKVGEIPKEVKAVASAWPGQSFDLGDGHRISVPKKDNE